MPDQLYVLIAFALLSGLKWLFDNRDTFTKSKPEETSREEANIPPLRTPPPVRTDTEEERVRKFLEALGLPTDGSAAPPPPVPKPAPVSIPAAPPPSPMAPPPTPAPPKRTFPQAPPRPTAPPSPFRRVARPPATPAPAFKTVETAAPEPEISLSSLPAFPQAASAKAPTRTGKRKAGNSLRSLLSRPESLRQAVLLREVLGPPKALQKN